MLQRQRQGKRDQQQAYICRAEELLRRSYEHVIVQLCEGPEPASCQQHILLVQHLHRYLRLACRHQQGSARKGLFANCMSWSSCCKQGGCNARQSCIYAAALSEVDVNSNDVVLTQCISQWTSQEDRTICYALQSAVIQPFACIQAYACLAASNQTL